MINDYLSEYGLRFEKVTMRFGEFRNIFNFFIGQMTPSEIRTRAVGLSADDDHDIGTHCANHTVFSPDETTKTPYHLDYEFTDNTYPS